MNMNNKNKLLEIFNYVNNTKIKLNEYLANDYLESGLADNATPDQFDKEQISKGIKVEMEHTNDPKIALEIAMDHLMENPSYYDYLEQMEDSFE